MNINTNSEKIDYLSNMPYEILEIINFYCCYECIHKPYQTFIQLQFRSNRTDYFEYIGEMRNGLPDTYGTLYHGSTRMLQSDKFKEKQTPWILQSLLYVYPNHVNKFRLLDL